MAKIGKIVDFVSLFLPSKARVKSERMSPELATYPPNLV